MTRLSEVLRRVRDSEFEMDVVMVVRRSSDAMNCPFGYRLHLARTKFSLLPKLLYMVRQEEY